MKEDIVGRRVWPVKVFPEALKNLSCSFVSVPLHVQVFSKLKCGLPVRIQSISGCVWKMTG